MKKILAFALCLVLVSGLSIAGTIAWLTDKTETITNTFTSSDIEITLTETANQEDGTWKAQLIPAKEYAKNPVVTVTEETDVDVYLFVKMEQSAATYLDFTNNLDGNGWTKLEEGVYYREVKTTDTTKSWNLIGDDKVTVKSELTEADLENASGTITYTAYAIQTEGFDGNVANAWAAIAK